MIQEITGHPRMGKWVKFYLSPSESNPEKSYVVSRPEQEEGAWGCSCPRWIFHREDCKHIRRIKHDLRLNRPGDVQQVQPSEQIQKALKRLSRAAFVEV